jgi:hypothetical protein
VPPPTPNTSCILIWQLLAYSPPSRPPSFRGLRVGQRLRMFRLTRCRGGSDGTDGVRNRKARASLGLHGGGDSDLRAAAATAIWVSPHGRHPSPGIRV